MALCVASPSKMSSHRLELVRLKTATVAQLIALLANRIRVIFLPTDRRRRRKNLKLRCFLRFKIHSFFIIDTSYLSAFVCYTLCIMYPSPLSHACYTYCNLVCKRIFILVILIQARRRHSRKSCFDFMPKNIY